MNQILTSVTLLAGIHFAAMLSPGPTALMVLRRGVQPQVRSMAPLVMGIVAATMTNTALTLLGVAAIIAASPAIALVLAFLGALYLFYLGARNILVAFRKFAAAPGVRQEATTVETRRAPVSAAELFGNGYLINLLNPKIAIFYVSIFSQVAHPSLPGETLAIFSGQMVLQSLLFWSGFAALTRAGIIRRALDTSNGWVDLLFGSALIAFALFLLASRL